MEQQEIKKVYDYLDEVPDIDIPLKEDLFQSGECVNLKDIMEAFKKVWGKKSVYNPDDKDVKDGSPVNQCNITALLMWEVFGLPIVIMKYYDAGRKSHLKTHYANLINESTIIDFSQGQYNDECILVKTSGELWTKKPYNLRKMAYGKMQDDVYFSIVNDFKEHCING